jgi:hypothetical protein
MNPHEDRAGTQLAMSFAQWIVQAGGFDALVSSAPIGSGACESVMPHEFREDDPRHRRCRLCRQLRLQGIVALCVTADQPASRRL